MLLQTQALAHWPDGSVRWLLLDFLIEEITAGEHPWTLHPRSGTAGVSPPPLTLLEASDEILVEEVQGEQFFASGKGIIVSSGSARSAIPVVTSWVRPARRRSMRRASSGSRGLPRTVSATATTVSAAIA